MNKLVKAVGLMLLCIASGVSHGQGYRPIKANSDLLYHEIKSLGSGELGGYLEHLPPDYYDNPSKKYPMIIFLHGLGERGNGNTQLYKAAKLGPPKEVERLGSLCFTVDGKEECFIVLSPQISTNNWSDAIQQPFWEHVYNGPDNYRFDPERVYLTGLSLGANGVWKRSYAGNNVPNKLAAIAPVAGWGNNSKGCVVAENEIPIWAFHGINDGTVGYDRGYSMFTAVERCADANSNTERIFTTIQGGHSIWNQIYLPDNSVRTPNLYQWFLTQTLNGAPTPAPTNASPIVDAGDLIETDILESQVEITAQASDPDGTIINYNWKKLNGPAVTIANSNKPTVVLTNLEEGEYDFRITVKDNDGATASDEVKVIVISVGGESSDIIVERTSSDGMGYLEYLPQQLTAGESLPVIIYLPTANGEGSSPTVITNEGPFKYLNQGDALSDNEQLIVLAPQVGAGNGFRKGEIQRFYDYVIDEYDVDENRIYFVGADEGATDLAYRLTDTGVTPDRWAAAAIIGGNAPSSIGCDIGNTDVNLYIGHSTGDTKYSYTKSQSLYGSIESCSDGNLFFKTLSGSHDTSIDNAFDPNSSDLYDWLLSHTLGEEPEPDTTVTESSGAVSQKISDQGVPYLEYLPPGFDADQAYPAIVYLHSEAAEGTNLNMIRNEGPFYYIDKGENLCVGDECFVVFAFQVELGSGFWKGKMDKFYNHITSNYNLDLDKIYLTGFDDGASNGLSRLSDNTNSPNRWAAVAAVGFKLNESYACGIAAAGSDFYLAHSTADEVNPFAMSQAFANKLDQCTSQEVLFNTLSGNHTQSWKQTFDPQTTDLYSWLLGKSLTMTQNTTTVPRIEINIDSSIPDEDIVVGVIEKNYKVNSDMLEISATNYQVGQIRIFGLDGRMVLDESIQGEVNLSNLRGSYYIYNITDDNGIPVQRGRILKY